MTRKGKGKRHHAEEEDMEGPDGGERRPSGNLMAPALLSVQPGGSALVVAIGAALRVVDLSTEKPITLADETTPKRHGNAVRAIAFDPSGRLFASGGDDKLVKLWDTSSWTCLRTMRAQKKISALAFSRDGLWLTFADKFGTLNVASTSTDSETAKLEPVQLLAHCCSIICDLAMSPDGRFIASADRDYKIRVSVVPENPLAGAHEIQSFCLGHTFFVGCIAFISDASHSISKPLLVSGGGDGTVRLWEPESGKLLDTYQLNPEHGEREGANAEEPAAVVALEVNERRGHIAVYLERERAVTILECNSATSRYELRLLQRVALPGEAPPTSMAFDKEERLWLVSGAAQAVESDDHVPTPELAAATDAQAHAFAAAAAVHVTVLQLQKSAQNRCDGRREGDDERVDASETEARDGSKAEADGLREAEGEVRTALYEVVDVPGGEVVKQSLEGTARDAAVAAAAAEAAAAAVKSQMSKKVYEDREGRKRARNDKKAQATGQADGSES